MKTIPLVFAAVMAATASARSQDAAIIVPTGEVEASIPGSIADGTPSPPAPKPEPIPFKVESSITRRVHVVESPEMPGLPAPEGTINVTVQLVKDPGLPDPPPPLPALPPDDPAVLARMAELTEHYHESQLAFVSATVYDHSRTYFRCFPSGGGGGRKEICGWSNLDFNHFSGFATFQFKSADGEVREYGLLMGIGNEDTQRTERLAQETETSETLEIPTLPVLATSGPAFTITEGDANDLEAMELIHGMHSLYRVEGARMEEAYHARIKAYEERKAYLLANPPKPKDLIINYWRGRRPDEKTQEVKP